MSFPVVNALGFLGADSGLRGENLIVRDLGQRGGLLVQQELEEEGGAEAGGGPQSTREATG